MSKEVILTGIRANNDLTLGNYFGAILPMVDMATKHFDRYQLNFFIPDLHSITTATDYKQIQLNILNNLRIFYAAGFRFEGSDTLIYRQSYISAHSELTWILDCFTGFGEMNRMTQFKDKGGSTISKSEILKIEKDLTEGLKSLLLDKDIYNKLFSLLKNTLRKYSDENLSTTVGLFNYPVLMAADILLYGATYVPVGDDQTQHLEFTRDIAERMNAKFGELFTVPKAVRAQHEFFGNDQGLRIKDLQDPRKKMSKSDESGKGVIFLGDKPEIAAKKIMSATTDSDEKIAFNWEKQPGITNLLQLLALATDRAQDDVNKQWEGKKNYGELKKAVADAVTGFLQGLQYHLAQVSDKAIMTKLEESEAIINTMANATLLKVQKAVGLR